MSPSTAAALTLKPGMALNTLIGVAMVLKEYPKTAVNGGITTAPVATI